MLGILLHFTLVRPNQLFFVSTVSILLAFGVKTPLITQQLKNGSLFRPTSSEAQLCCILITTPECVSHLKFVSWNRDSRAFWKSRKPCGQHTEYIVYRVLRTLIILLIKLIV